MGELRSSQSSELLDISNCSMSAARYEMCTRCFRFLLMGVSFNCFSFLSCPNTCWGSALSLDFPEQTMCSTTALGGQHTTLMYSCVLVSQEYGPSRSGHAARCAHRSKCYPVAVKVYGSSSRCVRLIFGERCELGTSRNDSMQVIPSSQCASS